MWTPMPIIFDVECIVCNKSLHKIRHYPPNHKKMGKVSNSNSRRLRTPNWSFDEKQYLLELIRTKKDVVVPKNNNGPNYSEEKDVAWNEILRELEIKFGSKFNGSSIKKVKTQWQNMKRIAREEIATNGPIMFKLTRQTLEVCYILDMIKDGVLQVDSQNNLNESTITTNVEIKTERIDEDLNQPSCSGVNSNNAVIIDDPLPTAKENTLNCAGNTTLYETASSASVTESNEFDTMEELCERDALKRNASIMTETTYFNDSNIKMNPFHKEMQQYFKFISAEKIMKMESLKEERHAIKAMRDTAELNKIIAEQKLKHVLWVKKQEMA